MRLRWGLQVLLFVAFVFVGAAVVIPWVTGVVFPTWSFWPRSIASVLFGACFGAASAIWLARRQKVRIDGMIADAMERAIKKHEGDL